MDVIPEEELKLRNVYEIHSRNLLLGVWTGIGFIGIRTKFGDRFLDQEYIWRDTGGTARPLNHLGVIPDGIEVREHYPSECQCCGKPIAYVPWGEGEVSNGYAGRWVCAGDCEKPRSMARTYTPLFDVLQGFEDELEPS